MLNPLDRNAPLLRQLYERFRQAIADGQLRPGDRVPSVRALASELKVSRGTVEAAYQILIGEGYLQARGPAGTVVAATLSAHPSPASASSPAPDWPLAQPTRPLPLQLGLPALDAFPRQSWTRLCQHALRQQDISALGYPDPCGEPRLRNALAGYLNIARGVACNARQVFVCAGYRAALELALHALPLAGRACWFEDPGYRHARHLLEQRGMPLVPVPVDSDGLEVRTGIALAPQAGLAIVTPSHQSPLNRPLALPRRLELLEWAVQGDAWIIEDDYDGEFHYHGRPLPALASLDRNGRVLYAGTLSKVLFPGLRLAYLVVPPALVERFEDSARSMQQYCPALLQQTAASFIEGGHFARHLKRMRKLYSERRLLLAQAITRHAGQWLRVDEHPGGMHLVAYLPPDLADTALADQARLHGLAVHALSRWRLASQGPGALLMSFTNVISAEMADDLAQRLAAAIRAVPQCATFPAKDFP